MQKYTLTNERIPYNKDGKTFYLRRIKRLSDGKLGGCINRPENLSQEGDCWIDEKSIVLGFVKISGNVQVKRSLIENNLDVYHGDEVKYLELSDDINIRNSYILGSTEICGNVNISDSKINNTIIIYDKNCIQPFSTIRKSFIANCYLFDHIFIKNAIIFNSTIENSIIIGNVHVEKSKLYTVTIQNPHDKFKLIILNKKLKYKNIRSKK